ncbi:MAG: hypothetical protein HRU09_14920 [Oligoflexales bacterium]|nr:hypothetical protein [Oligoflexales bacterium]
MAKNILLFIAKNHFVKTIALLVLLWSVYKIGSKNEANNLYYVTGFLSFLSVVLALFFPEWSKVEARNSSDKQLFDSIIDSIPFDEKFVYWFDRHNYGMKEYSSTYLLKFFNYFRDVGLDRSKFFHNDKLQHEFDHFMHAVTKFRKSHMSYTEVDGETVRGVQRDSEDYANDPTWYARVKELNENAAMVFNKYESFTIFGKETLMI